MEQTEKISKYLGEAEKWLQAAELSADKTPEPAAFNALHSLELAAKACLLAKTGNEYKTHNVGGEFGKFFREEIGREKCRELNKKLMKYDALRYPGGGVTKRDVREILEFVEEFVKETVPDLIHLKTV